MPVAAASKIFMVAILLCGTVKALMEDRVLTEDAKCDCGLSARASARITSRNVISRRWDDEKDRIINGKEVPIGKYPFVARIVDEDKHALCTGSLIHPEWVITAGHCVKGLVPKQYSIVIGGRYATDDQSDDKRVHRTRGAKVFQHPRYDDESAENDVGLIQLERPVIFSTTQITPVCLPQDDVQSRVSRNGTIVGWGSLTPGYFPKLTNILMEGSGAVLRNEECKKASFLHQTFLKETMMCFQDAKGSRTCSGDSGGPLLTGTGVNSDPFVIHGIVSWGTRFCPNTPSVFTKVFSYLDFIRQTTNSSFCKVHEG